MLVTEAGTRYYHSIFLPMISAAKYSKLSQEDFDAIVTGELTHYNMWLEDEIDGIICGYFIEDVFKILDFRRLFLLRDGLTFQDKIEIVRGMLPSLESEIKTANLKNILKQVEDFKAWRNAMAHGRDCSDEEWAFKLKIETVSRSGKEKILEITPESHVQMLSDVDDLLERLRDVRLELQEIHVKKILKKLIELKEIAQEDKK